MERETNKNFYLKFIQNTWRI